MIGKFGYGHICLRDENLSFNNNYMYTCVRGIDIASFYDFLLYFLINLTVWYCLFPCSTSSTFYVKCMITDTLLHNVEVLFTKLVRTVSQYVFQYILWLAYSDRSNEFLHQFSG